MSSRHQSSTASSSDEEFGIAGWDAEIDIGVLDNTANKIAYYYEDVVYDEAIELFNEFEVPNRLIMIYQDGTPIEMETLEINQGVGREIFNYMEMAGGPNLHELLWNPDTLYQWCVAVCHIGAWIDKKGGLARCWKAPFVFGAARFGQAMIFGGDKSVLQAAWEELEAKQFRSCKDWYKLINPNNSKRFREEVSGSNLHTRVPAPRENGSGYEMKDVADFDLLGIACRVMEDWCHAIQDRQKKHRDMIRRQAIVGVVCAMDLEDDGQRCVICLEGFAASTNKGAGEGANTAHIAVKTTCRHLFGLSCFNNWMRDHDSCPLCRQKLIGEDRLPHPRDRAVEAAAREEKGAARRKVNKRDVQIIREGLLAWDGLTLDAEQHVACAKLITNGRTQEAYKIMVKQLQTLRDIDRITGGPSCSIVASGPSLKFLVGGSFRDDWAQLHRNARRLIDVYSKTGAGDWNTWSGSQIKELKQMSIECYRRLRLRS